jgi:glycosyltransferase involved in cell wall biosynthesis
MTEEQSTQVPILFISDDSLTNPILRSQGLPLLIAMAKLGHTCSVLSFEDRTSRTDKAANLEQVLGDVGRWLNVCSIDVSRPGILPRWLMIYCKGLSAGLRIVLRARLTILHARSFVPAMIGLSLKLLLRNRVRLLYDNRGVFIDEEVYGGRWRATGTKVRLARTMEHRIITGADAIVVVSRAFRQHLLETCPAPEMNIHARVAVIPNKTILKRTAADAGWHSRLAGGTITGIYSGSAAPWQGIPDLVELFRTGCMHFSSLAFQILTYEEPEKFLAYFRDDDRLEGRVTINRLGPQEVAAELSKAHFGILLREPHVVNRVASPLKFSEYLACGLPVMLSDGIGDTGDIVRDYRVGVVVQDQNYRAALKEMIDLLSDPAVHARCLETAEREFNLDDSIAAYRAVYTLMVR